MLRNTSISTHRPGGPARALATIACALAALVALPAAAWSDRPVRFLVPAPPGGTMDLFARVLADQIAEQSKQPAIVDNRPGAGGAIAVGALLQAPADGQTVMVTASNVLVEIPLVLKVPFDPLRDLTPIAEVARANMIMVANTSVPANTLAEVIGHARSNPGKLAFASYSAGTASHYAGLILNQKAGLDLLHVPYKGSPPALADVMSGQVPLMFDGIVTSLPLVKAGKLKPYALAAKTRSSHLPNVPTFAELGYPDIDFGNWLGVVASAKASPELVARMNAEIARAAAAPKVRDRLVALGFEAAPVSSPRQLADSVRADYERNARIVKTFDVRFE
jgi:tripartite-type tricarboxylate transporter receptor subunit TctC